jgi:hypothetical protein
MTIGKMTEADQHLFFQRRIDELESSNRALNATLKGQQLTLRDQFAMAALQGLITRYGNDDYSDLKLAEWSYEQADAMLKARIPEDES